MSTAMCSVSSTSSGCKQNGDVCSTVKTGGRSDDDLFDSLFPALLNDLMTEGLADKETSDAFRWYKTVNEYNVPHGKRNRGLTVIHSYRFLLGPDHVTEEGLKLACVIGWCIEWLQAYFLIADDIMDNSITRRGQPCWYKRPEVGLIAVNDSFHLEAAIYVILRKYLKGRPYYVDILDLFHETTNQTVIGQTLDLITAPTDRVDFTNYTLDRYQAIVKYKTAYYSFYLPVAAAMYMVGITDDTVHHNAKTILLSMGEFFQIQDDYLDCYGDPSVTGKIGTDIEDNKCGWLVIQALLRANTTQREILELNYGRKEEHHVAAVRQVYADLNIESVYAQYEAESYATLTRLIDQLCAPCHTATTHDSAVTHDDRVATLPREMFLAYANKIYKRKK